MSDLWGWLFGDRVRFWRWKLATRLMPKDLRALGFHFGECPACRGTGRELALTGHPCEVCQP